VHENNFEKCPHVTLLIEDQQCKTVLDTGCQCSVISEELYRKLEFRGVNILELPARNVVIMSAFQGKINRIKLQVIFELNFNGVLIDHVFFWWHPV
jgi:hypothetical protein